MAKTKPVNYSAIMKKNKDRFASGKRFTRRQLVKMFRVKNIVHDGDYKNVQRSNLILVGVQAQINRLLSECGLYMRSKDYYSSFYIVDKEETKEAILKFQEKSEIHQRASARLEGNMGQRINAGTWGTYDNSSVPRISAFTPVKKSAVYKRKQARIKRW